MTKFDRMVLLTMFTLLMNALFMLSNPQELTKVKQDFIEFNDKLKKAGWGEG